jgi:ASC-1-like (ASCH) protein
LSKRFTEARPPPNPDDLPADLRKQMEEPVPTKMTELEMAALNGELENIPDSVSVPEVHLTNSEIKEVTEIKRDKVDIQAKKEQTALEAVQEMNSEFRDKQFLQLTEYVKLDSFNITFEDSPIVEGKRIGKRFYRVGLNQDLTEQIKDLQNQLETKVYLEGEHQREEISNREMRLFRKKLIKIGLNYLKDSQTHKTMTEVEAKKVLPGTLLSSIIDACIYRTVHDIVDPKV